ncbi:hypothetical protein [Ovoidimarina sediminis]|uniref:hypothetical protein n=1 Tax=Ovoidimarina sediminis TaxID=3079856 RepID=UPI00290B12DF|nr:hypothetical protein [Rhodophyticola sp. MJ-SS7]MDU8941899.1 hypothetical protein [Rhodophyticola sp. MJ-SS7]
MSPPRIAVAPYALRPGPGLPDTLLDRLVFPLGDAPSGRLADLGPEDHVIFYPKSGFYLPGAFRGIRAQPSLVIAEPRAVHGWHMRLLRLFHRRFTRILTRDPALLAALPNAVAHSHTFASLTRAEQPVTEKTRAVSLIASGKRDHPGHRLRHSLVERIRAEGLDVAVMGRGYAPFGNKEEGLLPFRFSVVIENCREPGYISEKLLDACLCRTVPIYWGAPDVGDYVDPRGLVICEGEDALMTAIREAAGGDAAGFAPYLEENRQRALALADADRRAALALKAALG